MAIGHWTSKTHYTDIMWQSLVRSTGLKWIILIDFIENYCEYRAFTLEGAWIIQKGEELTSNK